MNLVQTAQLESNIWEDTYEKAKNYTSDAYDKAKNASAEAYDKAQETAKEWIHKVKNNTAVTNATEKAKDAVESFEEWVKLKIDHDGKLPAKARKVLLMEWVDEMFVEEASVEM